MSNVWAYHKGGTSAGQESPLSGQGRGEWVAALICQGSHNKVHTLRDRDDRIICSRGSGGCESEMQGLWGRSLRGPPPWPGDGRVLLRLHSAMPLCVSVSSSFSYKDPSPVLD